MWIRPGLIAMLLGSEMTLEPLFQFSKSILFLNNMMAEAIQIYTFYFYKNTISMDTPFYY